MVSEVVDPPERLRERAQDLGETIAATARRRWRDQAGPVGCLGGRADRSVPLGAAELVSMWGHPDQAEGRAPSLSSGPSGRCEPRRPPGPVRGSDVCSYARWRWTGWRSVAPPKPGRPRSRSSRGRRGATLPSGELIARLFGVWQPRAGGVCASLTREVDPSWATPDGPVERIQP